MNPTTISQAVIEQLEAAWNAGDGAAFAGRSRGTRTSSNIRGELHSGTEAIAAGHQGIFDTIYRGSTVRYTLIGARASTSASSWPRSAGRCTCLPARSPATSMPSRASSSWRKATTTAVAAFHNTLVAGRP